VNTDFDFMVIYEHRQKVMFRKGKLHSNSFTVTWLD